jgi:hypothetical protein
VRSALPPNRSAAADYQIAIARARTDEERDSLTGREGEVAALHGAYAAGQFRPHQVARSDGWGNDAHWQRETWRLHSRRPLSELYGQALGAAGDLCLLCNGRRPWEVDHFLPKEHYPALAILHLNLIGVCDKCNKHKASSCETDPTKQFLHPYFERLPDDALFLNCSPFEDGNLKPLYTVDPPANWPGEIRARLVWQFGHLKLEKYFGREAVAYFNSQSLGWLDAAGGGWPALEQSLRGALRTETFHTGPNGLRPALLRALLVDRELQANPQAMILRSGPAGLADYL